MTRSAHLALVILIFPSVVVFGATTGVRSQDASLLGSSNRLTFNQDIAPIVFENCAACHRPGESAPFSLLSYQDVRKRAQQIAVVTGSRFMPPWLPEEGYGEFLGQRRLTPDQIATLRKWVEDGALEGDPDDLPPLPQFTEGWQLGEPDLVIEMAEPYTLPAGGRDVFRSFVIPIPLPTRKYVRAVEFRGGNPQIVHHTVMQIDERRSTRYLDDQDPEPGYDGMYAGEARSPDGQFLAWTPGKVPIASPEGMAWLLEKGSDLVLKVHFLPSGKSEVVRCAVGFYFTEKAPTRVPLALRLGSNTIDIPAGKKDYVIKDTYELPVDVEVLGVYPHAHYLARDMKGYATLPDGTTRWLIRIKEWDFNWQDEYRFAKPVFLPRGTRLEMEYTYDNSSDNVFNPYHPPRRVVYGMRSSDDMGDLWLQVVPTDSADLAILKRDFAIKDHQARLDGYKHRIRTTPGDAQPHYDLGNMLSARGKREEAIRHYRRAVGIKPDFALAHNNLGSVLLVQGKTDEAMRLFRQALRVDPDLALAHNNLGAALLMQGDSEEAIRHFRSALRAWPDFADVHYNLGKALLVQGSSEEAIRHYRQAVSIKPDSFLAHLSLGNALARQGILVEAAAHYERVLQIQPGHVEAQKNLTLVRSHLEKNRE